MAPALPSPLRAARKILVIRKTQSTRDVIAEIGESARSHRIKGRKDLPAFFLKWPQLPGGFDRAVDFAPA